MSIPTAAEVKTFAPEFASEADPRIEMFIGLAADYVNASQFGTKEKQALILVTCHQLKLNPSSGVTNAGPVSSEKVGDLQVSYAVASPGQGNEWSLTSYGQQFEALKRTIKRTPLVV